MLERMLRHMLPLGRGREKVPWTTGSKEEDLVKSETEPNIKEGAVSCKITRAILITIEPLTQSPLTALKYCRLLHGRTLVSHVRMSARQPPAAFDLHKA